MKDNSHLTKLMELFEDVTTRRNKENPVDFQRLSVSLANKVRASGIGDKALTLNENWLWTESKDGNKLMINQKYKQLYRVTQELGSAAYTLFYLKPDACIKLY